MRIWLIFKKPRGNSIQTCDPCNREACLSLTDRVAHSVSDDLLILAIIAPSKWSVLHSAFTDCWSNQVCIHKCLDLLNFELKVLDVSMYPCRYMVHLNSSYFIALSWIVSGLSGHMYTWIWVCVIQNTSNWTKVCHLIGVWVETLKIYLGNFTKVFYFYHLW